MDSDGFSVRIGEAHRLMIPIECRRKLDLKPAQIYDITIVSSDRMVKENFLAKLHSSGPTGSTVRTLLATATYSNAWLMSGFSSARCRLAQFRHGIGSSLAGD